MKHNELINKLVENKASYEGIVGDKHTFSLEFGDTSTLVILHKKYAQFLLDGGVSVQIPIATIARVLHSTFLWEFNSVDGTALLTITF